MYKSNLDKGIDCAVLVLTPDPASRMLNAWDAVNHAKHSAINEEIIPMPTEELGTVFYGEFPVFPEPFRDTDSAFSILSSQDSDASHETLLELPCTSRQ